MEDNLMKVDVLYLVNKVEENQMDYVKLNGGMDGFLGNLPKKKLKMNIQEIFFGILVVLSIIQKIRKRKYY